MLDDEFPGHTNPLRKLLKQKKMNKTFPPLVSVRLTSIEVVEIIMAKKSLKNSALSANSLKV